MKSISNLRRFGTVTAKVQKRREQYVRSKFPEYRGNVPETSADAVPRRGRRLGGSFADPSRPILKLDGSEEFNDSQAKQELEESFATKLARSKSDPQKLTKLLSDYHEAMESYTANKEPVSVERDRIIKSMSSVDYQVLSGASQGKLADAHHKRILDKNKFATVAIDSGESVGTTPPPPAASTKQRAKKQRPEPSTSDTPTFPILREENDMFPDMSFRLNKSVMTNTFLDQSLPMVDLYGSSVPSVVTSSMDEYKKAQSDSILFDVSYRRRFEISGPDAVLAMDHFISAPIRNLNVGDAINACILDTKGYVLSTCIVSRMSSDDYSVIIDGAHAEPVFRYMAQYIVYSRQSGLEVHMRAQQSGGTFLLVGPTSLPKLISGFRDAKILLGNDSNLQLPSSDYLAGMPNMSTVSTSFCQLTKLHSNKFLISLKEDENFSISPSFLNSLGPFGGAYALDMIRMESGEIRASSDIPSSTTPISASLAHLVDQRKVREKILFGHERIAKELLKQPSHRRVGIVASKYVYAGCRILSAPHRLPIGELTSCAWSPILQARVCQGYIKPEFAIDQNPVMINLPHEIPENLDFRFKRRIIKQGNLQSVFRRLIPARVVSFPIERPQEDTVWFDVRDNSDIEDDE